MKFSTTHDGGWWHDPQTTFTVSKAGERSVRSALASCGGQRAEVDVSKYEADWNTSPLDWMEQIDAMRQRAETAERQKREWVDEWRKACKRAQEAELERDTLRALRGEFAEYRQVDAMDRKTSEARIAQLEAALRRIAEKRGVAKEDAKRYLEGACDIADDALRPAEPKGE